MCAVTSQEGGQEVELTIAARRAQRNSDALASAVRPPPKVAIAICRVSSKKQAKDDMNSLPMQRNEVLKIAEDRKLSLLVPPIELKGKSGRKIQGRQDVELIMEKARAREIGFVIVTRIDRLGRSFEEGLRLAFDLQRWGVRIATATREYDLDLLENRILLVFELTAAEKYTYDLERITRASKERNFAAGAYVGAAAPFGMRKTGKKKSRRIEYEPGAVEVITDVYTSLVAAAIRPSLLEELAAVLEERHASWIAEDPGARRIAPARIVSIVRNETWLGYHVWGDQRRKIAGLKILEENAWESANVAIDSWEKLSGPESVENRETLLLSEIFSRFPLNYCLPRLQESVRICCPQCRTPDPREHGARNKGVWVKGYRCIRSSCGHQFTVPAGVVIPDFRHVDPVTCPNCRSVDDFIVMRAKRSVTLRLLRCRQCRQQFFLEGSTDKFARWQRRQSLGRRSG
jgi:DNA invertase Pin-like site-specific DNA recombinase